MEQYSHPMDLFTTSIVDLLHLLYWHSMECICLGSLLKLIGHMPVVRGRIHQTDYSVVAACVITLHWTDKTASQVSGRWRSNRMEGVLCLIIISFSGFAAGLLYRFSASFASLIRVIFTAVLAIVGLYFRQDAQSAINDQTGNSDV